MGSDLSTVIFETPDGGRLAYRRRAGPGPLVVFSHPWSTHGAVFEPLLQVWTGNALIWNRRGFGSSDGGRAGVTQEDDLAALLDHLGVTRAVLVGLGAGGAVSVAFAGRWPRRVAALLLVNTFLGQPPHFWQSLTGEPPPEGDLAARELSERFRRDPRAAEWLAIAAGVTHDDTVPPQPCKANLASIADHPHVAIATGIDDRLFTPAMLNEAARLLPLARTDVLLGVAHAAPFERPRTFADYLTRTLDAFSPA